VVGDDDHVYVAVQRVFGNIGVPTRPIRINGVHVKIDDEFVHDG
jgi:hypothetical protein